MHIGRYIKLVHKGQVDLRDAFLLVAKKHSDEADIETVCKLLASWSQRLEERAAPFADRYTNENDDEPDRLLSEFFKTKRKGPLALLKDLQDLWLMANDANVSAIILRQGAAGVHDADLIALCDDVEHTSDRQISWLLTRMKSSAPQSLIAAT